MDRPPRVPVKMLRSLRARRTLGSVVLALTVTSTARAQDGGLSNPWAAPLYSTCPAAPPPEHLDGGSWLLSEQRGARNACLAATCDARRLELEPAPPLPLLSMGAQVWAWVLFGAGLFLGAGGVGWLWWRFGR